MSTTLISTTSSRTTVSRSPSSRPGKILLKHSKEPDQLLESLKRRTLKLKSSFFEDENSTSSLQSLQSKETKKISMKRRLVGVVEALAKTKYLPRSEEKHYQAKVRLFDTSRKVSYVFRCFKEEELGYTPQITKLTQPTKQDNDVLTDDETLTHYVKRCQKDLEEAVACEKKRKGQEKKKQD